MESRLSISQGYSVYLDLFRIVAALVVVGAHAMMPIISGNHYMFPFGEDAVQAFFVLSGFVIASVVDGRENTFRVFAVARLSRLWSVLIPALLIGPAIVHFALHFWHAGYLAKFQGPILSSELARSFAAAVFVNEVWDFSLTPTFNVPLWSISFEFWYYAIFAIYAFAPKSWRWIGVSIAAACAGPQILLLMPGWILGAALYHFRDRIKMRRGIAIGLFVAGPSAVLVGHSFHLAPLLQSIYLPVLGPHFVFGEIFFARDFIWQNIVGVALAVHLAAAYVLFRNVVMGPARTVSVIRWAAGLTYSIYLLHFPAELALTGRLHAMHDGAVKVALIVIGATLISAAFGVVLEPLKLPLRRGMMRLVSPNMKESATARAA